MAAIKPRFKSPSIPLFQRGILSVGANPSLKKTRRDNLVHSGFFRISAIRSYISLWQRGMQGDFSATDSENLPSRLFYKEGNRSLRAERNSWNQQPRLKDFSDNQAGR
jgi:hypothetical protein